MLCFAATLAWVVNLPAAAVVVKGTQVDGARGASSSTRPQIGTSRRARPRTRRPSPWSPSAGGGTAASWSCCNRGTRRRRLRAPSAQESVGYRLTTAVVVCTSPAVFFVALRLCTRLGLLGKFLREDLGIASAGVTLGRILLLLLEDAVGPLVEVRSSRSCSDPAASQETVSVRLDLNLCKPATASLSAPTRLRLCYGAPPPNPRRVMDYSSLPTPDLPRLLPRLVGSSFFVLILPS